MGTLKFVGGTTSQSNEVSTRSQIESLLAGNLTQPQVTTAINDRLSAYATKEYADTQDRKLADSEFIDTADKTRLNKDDLDKPGFPFRLNADGKVPPDKVKIVSLQKYPNVAAAAVGTGGSTGSELWLMNLSVPDPGYAYKLLVTGTVSASIAVDNGSRPEVLVSRSDNIVVARGYGISETYQTPALGSGTSRMYVSTPTTPSQWPNGVVVIPAPPFNSSLTYHTDWQNLPFVGVNTDQYATTMSGTTYMVATTDMQNVSLTAQVSFANGEAPADAIPPNIGTLTCQMQIYSTLKGVIASSAPSNGKQGSSTLTASTASPISVSKNEWFTIQVKQSMYCPWGTLNVGKFATWAPTGSGTSNTLTMTPGLASGLSGGEISILPVALGSQSAITGPTTLSVRLQSLGGSRITALGSPSPRIMAIPIPV